VSTQITAERFMSFLSGVIAPKTNFPAIGNHFSLWIVAAAAVMMEYVNN